MKTLAIISHTKHYLNSDGDLVGLGSTVTEINHLLDVFDQVVHVAMLYPGVPPPNMLPYQSNRVTLVALPPLGGKHWRDKLDLLVKAPKVLQTIRTVLGKCDYFQFRAPTGMGVFIIPYLMFFSSKQGWFKYAGDWGATGASITYKFQRYLLKQQKRIVTINGKWQDQLSHCLTFENPCLTSEEVEEGKHAIHTKLPIISGFNLCYVGRLEQEKGIELFLRALGKLRKDQKVKLGTINIVGIGSHAKTYMDEAEKIDLNIVFHGLLSRADVHHIYKISHAIVLPSQSEGFPKVIAEAVNYGCFPVVSKIRALQDYFSHGLNVFFLDDLTSDSLISAIDFVLREFENDSQRLGTVDSRLIKKFTYNHYNERIINEILQ